jgi:hypothetical protein
LGALPIPSTAGSELERVQSTLSTERVRCPRRDTVLARTEEDKKLTTEEIIARNLAKKLGGNWYRWYLDGDRYKRYGYMPMIRLSIPQATELLSKLEKTEK